MPIKNTERKFGSLTKLLHWSIFVLFVVEFFLVYRREYFAEHSPEKLQYLLLHKSFGVILLLLALCMLIWRHVGTRPVMPANMSSVHVAFTRIGHLALYLVMLIQPITGITMSLLSGYKVAVFDWVTIPTTYLSVNKPLAEQIYTIHVWDSYVIIALVGGHILAALYHHFGKKDGVLKRMLPFSN